ncbi:MAG TPA: hypothetical protein VHX36_06220 [Candidatus Acidoferrales bacterium]|jgi:hypothetical protein|nr:hypothetical protein [Candidatus Acidoferrales bacterium]
MKKFIFALAVLLFAGFAGLAPAAKAQNPPPGKPLKIVLSRQSNVDPVEIMKHLSQKCPNISLTTNPQRSDFMVNAVGWSGDYRFMVIRHGGDTVYATETALLSNAVKNVCRYLNTHD